MFFRFLILLFGLTIPAISGGTLSGTVYSKSDGSAVQNAEIRLAKSAFRAVTDEKGFFEIPGIKPGRYTLIVTHIDFIQLVKNNIDIRDGEHVELRLGLDSPPGDVDRFMSGHTRAHSAKPKSLKTAPKDKMPVPPPVEFFSTSKSSPLRKHSKKTHPASSGLRAGYADDNRQFNYFLGFLEQYKPFRRYDLPVSERIRLQIKDRSGKPLANARVAVWGNGALLEQGASYADGTFFIFPKTYPACPERFRVRVSCLNRQKEWTITRKGPRRHILTLDAKRPAAKQIPLDLLFILDTTGSMGEEIQRLKSTIDLINLNLSSLNIHPQIRYGMVLYRDRDDEYDTKVVPFTSRLDAFREALDSVTADGGGDTPEDLQAALDAALHQMSWNRKAIRLAYIITDASLHTDYGQRFTYAKAAQEAKSAGIKLFTVGTGGLDIAGEYVLRQLAQYTYGKYIFLTYGEKEESAGGRVGSVSHHTGANFNAENLEAIIIRFTKQELAWQSDTAVEEEPSYFEANKIDDESKQQTLEKLFTGATQELIHFSAMEIPPDAPTAILPFQVKFSSLANNAEYFNQQFVLSVRKHNILHLIERQDLQRITEEIGLRLSGVTEEKNISRLGHLMGADFLISGRLYFTGQRYEIFLKLLRVETGEVLSVTRVRLDPKLGL